MNRPLRSLLQTILLAACALSLCSFTLEAEAAGNSGGITQSSHARMQKKRRRARRRARTARKPVREFVDNSMVTPARVRTVQGSIDVAPPDAVYRAPVAGANPSTDAALPPVASQQRRPIQGGILNGKAISLPKPPYPAVARAARASGTVVVMVIIDETGKVLSARAVSGHPLLQAAAVQAAYGARFSPTRLSGQPVKVTGTISYNFIP